MKDKSLRNRKLAKFQIKSFAIVTSWETQYGLTKIFKIIDANGNVYTWKTSGGLADDSIEIVGTVKSHNEYRDVKQTELTRVRTTRRADKEDKVCKWVKWVMYGLFLKNNDIGNKTNG